MATALHQRQTELQGVLAELQVAQFEIKALNQMGLALEDGAGQGEKQMARFDGEIQTLQASHTAEVQIAVNRAHEDKVRCLEEHEHSFLQRTEQLERQVKVTIAEKDAAMQRQEMDFLSRINEVEARYKAGMNGRILDMDSKFTSSLNLPGKPSCKPICGLGRGRYLVPTNNWDA